jgi:hypothetical protein
MQLVLVAAAAYAGALAIDYFLDDGRLGYRQVAIMTASVVALWAWRSRKRS